MKRSDSRHRWALHIGALLCLAACAATCITGCASGTDNPRETRSGGWQGDTAFGSFSFTVCEGGRRISDYALEYTIDGTTQAQALTGGDEVLIDKEGAFDLSTPEAGLTFRGQFSADGKSASGVWQVTTPDGNTLSEEWIITR